MLSCVKPKSCIKSCVDLLYEVYCAKFKLPNERLHSPEQTLYSYCLTLLAMRKKRKEKKNNSKDVAGGKTSANLNLK